MSEHRAAETKKYSAAVLGEGKQRVTVLVPEPDRPPPHAFVGAGHLIRRCLAAWLAGLSFRLEGPPGVGKNALVYALAAHLKRPLYVLQGHGDLEPQDLVCTPRMAGDPDWRYVASPLVAAMLCGGICLIDEIGKMQERALSPLSPVLDDRKTISSVLAGFSLRAHPEFRFCATMNPSDPALPDYIEKRLRPRFAVSHPSHEDLARILAARFTDARSALLDAFRDWAALAGDVAPRDAIAIIEFAHGLARLAGRGLPGTEEAKELIGEAAEHVMAEG